MLLKLLLLTGILRCKCRIVCVRSFSEFDDWYFEPSKGHTVTTVPSWYLESEVVEIVPREFGFDIYVK